MATIGSQVGQFVARRHAEQEVRASESRLRAMLEAALDAVVTMDHRGEVIGWNQAAERDLGYHASEAIGREMAELIVPPDLRQRHRQGLARFLEGQRPVILDHRIELTGMRRDGTEFPVELTITKIPLPGQPTFTGYVRDITERVAAEQALRASRARLVEVADDERKRIQRNLHDGAQQRLTGVLLNSRPDPRSPRGTRPPPRPRHRGARDRPSGDPRARRRAPSFRPRRARARCRAAGARARAPVPVELQALPTEPLREPVEAAVYYVVAEALANATKHAGASSIAVRAERSGSRLVVQVVDDGVGGADTEGTGLRGLADRVEALGGRLSLESSPEAGTRLLAEIPLG